MQNLFTFLSTISGFFSPQVIDAYEQKDGPALISCRKEGTIRKLNI